MLKAVNINKSFGPLHVLKGANLSVKKGEIVSIVGASGAGKSTLLYILGTLDRPDEGDIFIDGKRLESLRRKMLARFRNRRIGFIFQFHNLLPEFTAYENICIPAYLGGRDEKIIQKKGEKLMDILGIKERASFKPSALSGGELQRTSVARALINDPSIVFADEPSGNLDSKNADELHRLFFTLRRELDQTFVIVTHNEALANMADRKLEMKDGILHG